MKLKDFNPIPTVITSKTNIQFSKFPSIDCHMHLGKLLLGDDYHTKYLISDFFETLDQFNIQKIVNLDGFWGDNLDEMLLFTQKYKDRIATFMWIDFEGFDEEDWESKTTAMINQNYKKGAVGIKMWKDISLYKKDKHNQPIQVDDPRLNVVYETAAQLGIPILIHIADPVAFFNKLDENNERYDELIENPDWHFYDSTQYMSFEKLLETQENMIKNNPSTTFIVAHVGSYAENLSYVSNQLDRYPNLFIDISARIAELGRVPYSARKFFIKYADRILFGTDSTPLSMDYYQTYFRFLESDDEYFSYHPENETPGQGRWKIYGLSLPCDVLKKVYYDNANRIIFGGK